MDTFRPYGQQLWNRSLSFLNSDGLIPQLILTVIIVLVIHFLIVGVESIVNAFKKYNQLSATLLPYTYTSTEDGVGTIVVSQSSNSKYPRIYPSENEVNGVEFSYSFHLYVNPSNYTDMTNAADSDYYTVFYKGDRSGIWPIMGPGVFMNAKENKMRIYMNTVLTVKDQFVEVPNIPLAKWFHVVITQKGQNMDVYINGNIAVRKTFVSVPYINYGDVFVFPTSTLATIDNEKTTAFGVKGPMKGMISRLKYYAYALSFSQIDSLYSEGASEKIISKSMEFRPPYLHDSWWVTRYNGASPHYGL